MAGRDKQGWELLWRTEGGAGSGAPIPALGPDTEISLLVQSGPPVNGIAGTLIVLAPPGTTQITYESCPADGTTRYTAEGDWAVLPLKPRDLEGTIGIQAPGGLLSIGEPGNTFSIGGSYPIHPIPLPAGYREVTGAVVSGAAAYRGAVTLEDARLLLRCQMGGDALVTLAGGKKLLLPCNGKVQTAADGLTLPPGAHLFELSRGMVDMLLVVPAR